MRGRAARINNRLKLYWIAPSLDGWAARITMPISQFAPHFAVTIICNSKFRSPRSPLPPRRKKISLACLCEMWIDSGSSSIIIKYNLSERRSRRDKSSIFTRAKERRKGRKNRTRIGHFRRRDTHMCPHHRYPPSSSNRDWPASGMLWRDTSNAEACCLEPRDRIPPVWSRYSPGSVWTRLP